MTDQPHHRPEFANAVTYAVMLTITVQGGKRRGTADRRARKVAERLANAAARSQGVVDVSASAGVTVNGEVFGAQPVRFAAANSGTYAEPDRLGRYLDPEHERAVRSLAEENAAAQRRRRADRDRRRSVGCGDTYAISPTDRHCRCVYCQPEDHYQAVQLFARHGPSPLLTNLCLCGTPVATAATGA